MRVKKLNKSASRRAMEEWKQDHIQPALDNDYTKIRYELTTAYNKTVSAHEKEGFYSVDLHYGLFVYDYLNSKDWFSVRLAADDEFWSYITLRTVPAVTGMRWGNDNEDHFYKRPSRNWFRVLWWFIHLSWQGDEKSTLKLLEQSQFNQDIVLNLVERCGRGFDLQLTRALMKAFGNIPYKEVLQMDARLQKVQSHSTFFRTLMRMNQSTSPMLPPEFCSGGVDGYVQELIKKVKDLL